MKRSLSLLPSLACLPLLAIATMTFLMAVSPAPAFADAELIVDETVVDGDAVGANVLDAVHDGDHAHDGDHGDEAATPILSFDFGSAFWNLVIFLVVLTVLSLFVWPNVLHGLQAREDKIREDLEYAEKANADAKAILAGYELKLDEAATQVQKMLAEARKDAEANGQKIIDQAKLEAASQRERAVADIENAKKVALSELASRTSEIAMQVARGVVGRELSDADHADLIRQSIERLPSQN